MGLRGLWLAKQDGKNLFHKFRLDRLSITTAAFDAELSQYAGGDKALFQPLGALNYKLRKRTLSRKILPGQDDWLFLWSDQADIDPLEQRLGLSRLSPLQMREIVLQYQQRAHWATQHNSEYLVLLAPNKASVYGEYWPENLPLAEQTFLDEVYAALQNAQLPVLDLRPPLQAAKAGALLYYRHDTHWNDRGAYVGTQAVLERLGVDKLATARFRLDAINGGDQLRMGRLNPQAFVDSAYRHLGPDSIPFTLLDDPTGYPNDLPYKSKNDKLNGPKLLLLHDSFGHAMRPWFSYACPEFSALWTWGEFRPIVMRQYKPDYVVDEIIERNLARPFPGNHVETIKAYWLAHWPETGANRYQSKFGVGQLQAWLQAQPKDQLLVVKLKIMAEESGNMSVDNGLRVKQDYVFDQGEHTLIFQVNPNRPLRIELNAKASFSEMEVIGLD